MNATSKRGRGRSQGNRRRRRREPSVPAATIAEDLFLFNVLWCHGPPFSLIFKRRRRWQILGRRRSCLPTTWSSFVCYVRAHTFFISFFLFFFLFLSLSLFLCDFDDADAGPSSIKWLWQRWRSSRTASIQMHGQSANQSSQLNIR